MRLKNQIFRLVDTFKFTNRKASGRAKITKETEGKTFPFAAFASFARPFQSWQTIGSAGLKIRFFA